MKRAIAAFGLVGLLCAGLLAAADGAPAVPAGEPGGLCAAATPMSPELGVPAPSPRVTCTAVAYCPGGGQVSCYSGTWDLCETYWSCSEPWTECGVRCLNTWRYCPGYSYSTCSC